jgi:hypothetical protein
LPALDWLMVGATLVCWWGVRERKQAGCLAQGASCLPLSHLHRKPNMLNMQICRIQHMLPIEGEVCNVIGR